MTTDSPSSSSPKPDENPIQRASKPEMLEKARQAMDVLYEAMKARGIVTTMMYDFGIPPVALALEEAGRAADAELSAFCAEKLRASETSVAEYKSLWLAENAELVKAGERVVELEASVESLRKESDERADRICKMVDVLQAENVRLRRELPAARAEATKAETLGNALSRAISMDPFTESAAREAIRAYRSFEAGRGTS